MDYNDTKDISKEAWDKAKKDYDRERFARHQEQYQKVRTAIEENEKLKELEDQIKKNVASFQPIRNSDPYEDVKVIDAWGLNFNLGQVLRYIHKASLRGFHPAASRRDVLKKAAFFLQREIEREDGTLPLPLAEKKASALGGLGAYPDQEG